MPKPLSGIAALNSELAASGCGSYTTQMNSCLLRNAANFLRPSLYRIQPLSLILNIKDIVNNPGDVYYFFRDLFWSH